MKIAHISDLHILKMSSFQFKDLVSKRVVGCANLFFHRSSHHSSDVVKRALETIQAENCDHLAVSGDLSNLALDSEFDAAKSLLLSYTDDPSQISVVPGNHDYYVYSVVREHRFEQFFNEYQSSDLPELTTPTGYPFVQFRENVAIIGINSCIASPPFFAVGNVDEDELNAFKKIVKHPEVTDRFTIVMLHHPVFDTPFHRVAYFRRLINADSVLDICRKNGVNLLIHGHNHSFLNHSVPLLNQKGVLRICEPGSISVEQHNNQLFGGKFNIYHIEDKKLVRIETHLYEHVSKTFRRWRDVTYPPETETQK